LDQPLTAKGMIRNRQPLIMWLSRPLMSGYFCVGPKFAGQARGVREPEHRYRAHAVTRATDSLPASNRGRYGRDRGPLAYKGAARSLCLLRAAEQLSLHAGLLPTGETNLVLRPTASEPAAVNLGWLCCAVGALSSSHTSDHSSLHRVTPVSGLSSGRAVCDMWPLSLCDAQRTTPLE
jgi:hypothetical protein